MAIYAEQLTKLDDIFAKFALDSNEEWNTGMIRLLNNKQPLLIIPVAISILIYFLVLYALNIFRKMKQLNQKQKFKISLYILYPIIHLIIYFAIINIILLTFKYSFSRPRPYQTEEYHQKPDQSCYLNFIPSYRRRKQDNICNFSNITSFFSGHVTYTFYMFLISILVFQGLNNLLEQLYKSQIINQKIHKILNIYNLTSIIVLTIFFILCVPLTMIGRIVAYKHFWTDVVTGVVMSLFVYGLTTIITFEYQDQDFNLLKQEQKEISDQMQI